MFYVVTFERIHTFNYFSFWNKKSIFVDELIYNSISFC